MDPQGHWDIDSLPILMKWPPPWLALIRATLSVMVSDQPHEAELLPPHLLPVSIGSQIPHSVKYTSNLSWQNPSLARYLFKANISIYFAKFKAWPAKENTSGYPRWSTHPSKFSEKHFNLPLQILHGIIHSANNERNEFTAFSEYQHALPQNQSQDSAMV